MSGAVVEWINQTTYSFGRGGPGFDSVWREGKKNHDLIRDFREFREFLIFENGT